MLFSIVTVVLNDRDGMEKTIKSVLNQTYKDYEYVIFDGKSSDGTFELVKEYSESFIAQGINVKVYSEIDSGIYNAMNKGISEASGKYTIFMNAGDTFADSNILEKFESVCRENFDAVYGNHIFILNEWERIIYAKSIDEIVNNMPFCHQSIFTKTEILRKYRFKEKYKICADYDMFLRMYKDRCSFKKVNIGVARYNGEGLSASDYGRRPEIEKQIIKYDNGIISVGHKFRNDIQIHIKYCFTRFKYAVKFFVPQGMLLGYREKKFLRQGWNKVEK